MDRAGSDSGARSVPLPRRHGRPIRYGYVAGAWPLDAYQTVFAASPGSAEMPSAGRPFTAELVTALVARGVGVAPLVLHTGVSSLEAHEPPVPRAVRGPGRRPPRARERARAAGGRVVAVGTTVVRALESAADADGTVARRRRAGPTWSSRPSAACRVVDGLLTGWHEPRPSHLRMLEAIAGRPLLERVVPRRRSPSGYLWHEFGDVHLILP